MEPSYISGNRSLKKLQEVTFRSQKIKKDPLKKCLIFQKGTYKVPKAIKIALEKFLSLGTVL